MGWKYWVSVEEARDGSRICRYLMGGHRWASDVCDYGGTGHVHCARWFCHAMVNR